MEHPRCYRSAKCNYYGQETGCENQPYSTSPLSAPSPGAGPETPHQSQENRNRSGGAFGCALWSDKLCGKERRGAERDQGYKGESSLVHLRPRRFCALSEYGAVPQHMLSAVAAQKDVSICETHFVSTLPRVIYLMSSWPWRDIPLWQH